MISLRWLAGCAALLCSTLSQPMRSYAQVTCIQQYAASAPEQPLAFAPSDIENLVGQISQAIGLSAAGIRAVPCSGIGNGNVMAISYFDRTDIPKGDYILYDPIWVRQVIGVVINRPLSSERDEAVVLFGHELGHLLGRHFTTQSDLSRLVKETEADRFGGCAASAMNAKWENVANLLGRLRGDYDTTYPSREHSIAAAREGFNRCGRRVAAEGAPSGDRDVVQSSSQAQRLQGILTDLTSDTTAIRRDARKTLVQFLAQLPPKEIGPTTSQLVTGIAGKSYRTQLGISVALARMPGEIAVSDLSATRTELQKVLRTSSGRDATLRDNVQRALTKLVQA